MFARHANGVYAASDEDSEFQRLTYFDLARGKKEVLSSDIPWDITRIAVARDGTHLAFIANENGTSAVFLATTGDVKHPRRLKTPRGWAGGLMFDRAGGRLGFSVSTSQTSSDVYVADVESAAVTRWTFSETGGLPPDALVTPELVEFPSFDKRMIPAWYYRPKKASDAPVPVVINIHGGPEAQAVAGVDPSVQYWVNELGVAVLVPNVRGSKGYGKSYLAMDNGEKREDSVRDVGALLDWVATRAELDRTKVAVVGGSYGGYMVLATMFHHPDRIRCGVDIVGISNFVTFLEHTEDYRKDLRRAEYGDEREPKMRKFLDAISPTTNAQKIRSPLFVVQGQNDPRVPVTEAEQMLKTVRGKGGATWYLLAKDEGHGFQKKKNRDVLMQSVGLFLQRHLLGAP